MDIYNSDIKKRFSLAGDKISELREKIYHCETVLLCANISHEFLATKRDSGLGYWTHSLFLYDIDPKGKSWSIYFVTKDIKNGFEVGLGTKLKFSECPFDILILYVPFLLTFMESFMRRLEENIPRIDNSLMMYKNAVK